MADYGYYHGDYIRHPVLYELSHKYGLQTESLPESALPYKLEELKEHIRKEIRKELKIKEGAEKLREVAKDRKSLSDVAHIVKKSNSKLSELQAELQELESQIILTQGQDSDQHSPKNGHEDFVVKSPRPLKIPQRARDGLVSPMSGMSMENQTNNFATDLRLLSLEKQLNIELKVKHGAENMLQSLENSGHSRDKKLIGEAQQMLADSKAKIEFLKMRILKVRQNKANASRSGSDASSNGDSNNKDKLARNLEPPGLEDRVEELRHRLRIEAAVVEGAKNVIRLLQSSKVADKKALQEGRVKRKSPAGARKTPRGSRNGSHNKSTTASSSDGKKTPRTVHIDVYCTGSESSDSSSSDEETASTPQTVFESDNVKVIHSRANSDTLPHALQRQKRCVLSNPSVPSISGSISSGYPSAHSSVISGTDGFSLTSGSILSSAAVTSAKDTDFSSRDSFDYENSFDRLRIREKERLWAGKQTHGTMTEESSESSSDSEGMAWSFDRVLLKREDTVKRTTDNRNKASTSKVELSKSGSLSDSETSLKYKREALTKKPCQNVFQHLSKASKFGPIVSTLKKPGHHVGPSKNPNCSCDTCRYFFEHICYRNRTRSLGDKPLEL